jgi:hypothetical protein
MIVKIGYPHSTVNDIYAGHFLLRQHVLKQSEIYPKAILMMIDEYQGYQLYGNKDNTPTA